MATTPTAQTQGSEAEATVAELQRANAALRQQLEERDAERDAALAREAALAEVLAAINASPADPAPVFRLILEKAHSLCGADLGALTSFDGAHFHTLANHGFGAQFADMVSRPFPPTTRQRTLISGERYVHVPDTQAVTLAEHDKVGRSLIDLTGTRTFLMVALRKDGMLRGFISAHRLKMRPFSDAEITLLESFAAQAVIAIENARLITEQREALETQTATADVLKVISRSIFDLRPVLDTVLRTAGRLTEADVGFVAVREGEVLRGMATFGASPEHEVFLRDRIYNVDRATIIGTTASEGRILHIEDVATDPDYKSIAVVRLADAHTVLGVPLLREGKVAGVIGLIRKRVERFTDRQIDLVSNFADQALIAIENTRLITEQREALEQQTATAEVLGVINVSSGNLAPVFDTMLENAMRLCEAAFGLLYTYDGDRFVTVAMRGVPAALIEYRSKTPPNTQLGGPLAGLLLTKRPVHVRDFKTEQFDDIDDAARHAIVNLGGGRTLLMVPLLKDDAIIGMASIYRQEVRAFSEKQIALLENFAAQAVIAMENARLITEQREALEQQTATAEILGVINASPGDLAPVFDAVLEKAMRLCGAAFGSLYTYDGKDLQSVAQRGVPAAFAAFRARTPPVPRPGNIFGRMLATKAPTQVLDAKQDPAYQPGLARESAVAELGGARSIVGVPLMKEGTVLGFISIYRQEVRIFSDKQVSLLENFAAQAVIAMENARLITEQREALEQQTATAEVLGVINANPGELTPVFNAIVEKAMAICGCTIGAVATFDGEFFHNVTTRGFPDRFVATILRVPFMTASARALVNGAAHHHIPDLEAALPTLYPDGNIPEITQFLVQEARVRTNLAVSLRKDGQLLGSIALWHPEVRPFSAREITLLQNFAAQAVIAMENARLITEQREALEQQTATAEVLGVINASPGDLAPVFEAILEKAHTLCGASLGHLQTYDGEFVRVAASRGLPEEMASVAAEPFRPGPSQNALIAGTERYTHFLDIRAFGIRPESPALWRAWYNLIGTGTYLQVPLRKDGRVVGFINALRPVVRPFSDKEIALLENFAAQAVIAMENARLITEQREALEQQTATAEVLQVINASPGNLAPVFDAMLDKAMRLCGFTFGMLRSFDGARLETLASRGVPEAFAAFTANNPMITPRRGSSMTRALEFGRPELDLDIKESEGYKSGVHAMRAVADLGGARTVLHVPLVKDGVSIGLFTIYRQEVLAFTDKQIALLQNFAAQAVVAMENARLLNELHARTDELAQRQSELRVTFENMGDGVAMFDGAQRLVAWNQKFQDILDLPDAVLAERKNFADYIRYQAERGEYGTETDVQAQVARITANIGQHRTTERTRPDGRVIEIRNNPVDGGGFVVIYADITERKHNEAAIAAARDAAEEATRTIETAFRDLKIAQANLVQAEKMASLGQLTAGIAHEIKNPLNFVNNFAALSVDLLGELQDAAAPGFAKLDEDQRAEIDDLSTMLTSNLQKITEHGKRADGIVKSMLEHSRGASGERRAVDINALAEEALNLAYHGARAQDQSFNITLERDYGADIAPIELNPQDIMRVLLNIIGNGFYAATKRARARTEAGFEPTMKVTTRDLGEEVEIRVRDNGTGISAEIRDKLFQPFFTTKPAGEGTGLGLSITYDIVTQQHGGTIAVESEVGDHAEFIIVLPRQMFAEEEGRA